MWPCTRHPAHRRLLRKNLRSAFVCNTLAIGASLSSSNLLYMHEHMRATESTLRTKITREQAVFTARSMDHTNIAYTNIPTWDEATLDSLPRLPQLLLGNP
jgi:hypothetical protein